MGRKYPDPPRFQIQNGLLQIVRVEERDTEHGSHGGTDHLRVVDIHSITAHNESRDPRALSGSQDRSQVSWILKIFQHHQMSWTVTL